MSGDLILGVLSGALCLTAAMCVGTHEILLGPDRPNYPNAPRHLRVPMFVWSGVLLYRGMELLSGAVGAHPPLVTPGIFMGSFMVAAVHGLLLEAHLRQWLPARVHARIRHLLNIATCGRSRLIRRARQQQNRTPRATAGFLAGDTDPGVTAEALLELSRQGVIVIAPLEGPEALSLDPLLGMRP